MSLLKEISKDRLVLASTHDRRLAEEYGDRIIKISSGRVVSDTADGAESDGQGGFKAAGKPPRLPAKAVMKMAMHGLTHSIPRLAFSLISSFVGVSAFLASASFLAYDGSAKTYEALKTQNVSYISLTRSALIKENYSERRIFQLDELQYLESMFGKDIAFSDTLSTVYASNSYNGGE